MANYLDSLKETNAQLEKIRKNQEAILKSAKEIDKSYRRWGGSAKANAGGNGVNSASGNGMSAPSFSGGGGGGGGLLGSFARGAGNFLGHGVAAIGQSYGFFPDHMQTINWAAQAGIAANMSGRNEMFMRQNMRMSLGTGMSGVGSDAEMTAIMAGRMTSSQMIDAGNVASGMFKRYGVSNAESAAASVAMTNASSSMNLFKMGIFTTDPRTGKRRTESQIAKDMVGRFRVTAFKSIDDLNTDMNVGWLGQVTRNLDPEARDQFQRHAIDAWNRAHGVKSNDPKGIASTGRLNQAETNLMDKSADPMAAGFDKANHLLAGIDDNLAKFAQTVEGAHMLKWGTWLETMAESRIGEASLGTLKEILGAILATGAGNMLGRGGGIGGAGGRLGGTFRGNPSSLSRASWGSLSKGAMAARLGLASGLGLAAWGADAATGYLNQGNEAGITVRDYGLAAANVGRDALAGAAIGSVIPGVGTAVGAVAGTVFGIGHEWYKMSTQGDQYGVGGMTKKSGSGMPKADIKTLTELGGTLRGSETTLGTYNNVEKVRLGSRGGGSSSSSGKGGTAKRIWDFLISKGFTEEAAAAVLGNFQQESGLNPSAVNSAGYSGLAQWDPSHRLPALKQFAKKRGTSWDDLDTQLAYMMKELRGGYSGTLKQMRSASSTNSAVSSFLAQYEGVEGDMLSQRQDYAQGFFKRFASHSEGAWRVNRDQLAKIHDGEMILPNAVAQSVRDALAQHSSGMRGSGGTNVTINVTLSNASNAEAERLVRTVKRALERDDRLDTLAST